MLLFEERQLFSEQDGPLVRNIQTGERMFSRSCVERVLCPGGGVATRAGGEDLRHVVQGLGVGVSASDGELFEQVIGAELNLRAVIVRFSAIGARAGNAQVAVCPADSRANNRIRRWARRNASRDQAGEQPASRKRQDCH